MRYSDTSAALTTGCYGLKIAFSPDQLDTVTVTPKIIVAKGRTLADVVYTFNTANPEDNEISPSTEPVTYTYPFSTTPQHVTIRAIVEYMNNRDTTGDEVFGGLPICTREVELPVDA